MAYCPRLAIGTWLNFCRTSSRLKPSGARYGFRLTTVDDRATMMVDDRASIESALRNEVPLAPFMAEQSGEAASNIIAAVQRGDRYTGIMNLPNIGQIANLPREAVVETFGVIDHTGAQPLTFGVFPPAVESLIARHVANQETTVEAALTGNRQLALLVLLNDPLMRGLDVRSTAKMLNEMLEANRAYLPLFFLPHPPAPSPEIKQPISEEGEWPLPSPENRFLFSGEGPGGEAITKQLNSS
jgi:alpha-galactosidase/6-phospho-beta-glucosidase family protein